MNDQLKLVITKKGLEECITAKSKGISLNLKWVSAGDRDYTPNADQTSLVNEIQRVEFGEYKNLGGNQIQAVGKFSGDDEYPIKELGFWLESGTLFGVISAPSTTLNYKAPGGVCIQPITLDLSALPSDTVQVVVGTENLNILIEEEFAKLARTQVDSMHRQILQVFELNDLAKVVKGLEGSATKLELEAVKADLSGVVGFIKRSQDYLDVKTNAKIDDLNGKAQEKVDSVVSQLTAAFVAGKVLISEL